MAGPTLEGVPPMPSNPTGVFCAAATPLDAELNPDYGALAQHCLRLLDDGCHGIALLGSTGEANSFSSAERMAMLDAVVVGGVPAERLLPGTGLPAAPDTIALTRHALSLGVTTVVMLPPFYYKNVSDTGLIDSYSRVIDGVADDRLRIVLYHIPPISQIPITLPVIEALSARYPATIAGIKDSSGDYEHMKTLVRNFPGLSVLAGADPLMLPLLKEGGAGCITATANLIGADLRYIFDNHTDSAVAAEIEAAQMRVTAMRTIANTYVQIPSVKAMIASRSGQSSWARVRPPLMALAEGERAALAGMMNAHSPPV
jgi:4-hydroxy-tetrahydrodipicolinate synthase